MIKRNSKYELIVIVLIVLLAAFLRFYRLSDMPPALYQDEAAIGYNAYSILETGKDEYGKSFPLYFQSFGDYKLPVYIYMTAVSEKIFGINEFAVRFPSAILGTASVFFIFALVLYLTKNSHLAALSALLLAINPWSLQFSRAAFEVNGAMAFLLMGVYFLLRGIHNAKIRWVLLSILFFVLSFYSYNVSRLLVPVLVLSVFLMHIKRAKSLGLQFFIIPFLIAGICMIPFLITFFTPSGVASASYSLITGLAGKVRSVEMQSFIIGFPSIFKKIFYGYYTSVLFLYFQNTISIVSGSFFFVNGPTNGNQGIGNYGLFHLFEFPLFLFGTYSIFHNKNKQLKLVITWLIVAVAILALSKEVPQPTRGFFLVIPMEIITAYGGMILIQAIYSLQKIWRYSICILCVLFIFYSLQYYLISYYVRYPIVDAASWRITDKQLALFLKSHEKECSSIIVDSSTSFLYAPYVFYTQYSPDLFIKTAKREKKGLLTVTTSFGKVEVRNIKWGEDMKKKGTCIVTNGETDVSDMDILATISQPIKPVVIIVDDIIAQYPVTKKEFIVVKTKGQ